MRKCPYHMWCCRLVVLPLAMALLVLTAVSCRHQPVRHHVDDERYIGVDSLLRNINDVDSLAAIVKQSREQNDALTEMLALKYQGKQLGKLARFSEALETHQQGLEVATRLADTIEMVIAYNALGTDCRRMGDLSLAQGYFYKALKLCDSYSDKESDQALMARVKTLNGIARLELGLCDYVTADSVSRQALEVSKRLENNSDIAFNYGNLGSAKCAIGENDSALYYYRKSMEYNRLANSKTGIAQCHLHFGEIHELERRFYHAVEEYEMAYKQLKENNDTWYWVESCLALARVKVLLGEKTDADRYLTEAETEARRTGCKNYLAEASMIRYELSLLEGNPQEALQHYIYGSEMYDSIYGLKISDEMKSQRLEYERLRSSDEVDVLNRDINQLKRTRNLQWLFMVLLFLLAAALVAALAYVVKVRTRTQRLMRQVEETRSLFFTNVVHQLRTPLSAIMGSIDSILAEDKQQGVDSSRGAGNAVRENAEIIERQGKNLLVLVDRILEVGGVRSAITELDWRTGDLTTFMHMVVESYRERCVERHIELTYASCETNVDIDTVPRYLSAIVGSLLDNAINYSHEFGKITVTSHVDKGMFVIRVADDGMGISKADLPHVFEPFFRSANAEAIIDGVGIGLTVVRDMVMAMGGFVAVDSMKDHGAVFTVKLPCKHDKGVKKRFEADIEALIRKLPHARRNTSAVAAVPAEGCEEMPAVLVVEDHNDVARLVGQVLKENYRVHYATDGSQGLSKAVELMPDLIITDVKMPLMDGLELCRQIRTHRSLCHIPIIMLSARNSDADRVKGIEAGADAYLVKPFVREELLAWVSRLIESRRVLRNVITASRSANSVEMLASPLTDGSDKDAAFIERFKRKVDKQMATGAKLDFDKIALSFKMGEMQLRRRVQELTGKTMSAYLTQLRMEKALRLLQENRDMLIGDIAEQCGFQDVAYFSRVFRQYYDMTPTQARNASK